MGKVNWQTVKRAGSPMLPLGPPLPLQAPVHPPQTSAAVSGLTQAYTLPPSPLCPHPHSPFTSCGQATPSPAPWPQQALTDRTVPLLTLQRRGREGAREQISPSGGQKPLIPSQPHPFHEVGRGSD